MNIVTLKIDDGLLLKIDNKVKQYHNTRSEFIREAILSKLEDLEDIEAFENTTNDKLYTIDDVRKNLELAN
jgi:metal-responsive CopG/Arc/MetJ family transcriptional regulator